MSDSIESVIVAVKRHVCRSFGRASKRYDSSGANVGVKSRSASSRTYETTEDQYDGRAFRAQRTRNLTRETLHSPFELFK